MGFGINDVEPLDSATRVLISLVMGTYAANHAVCVHLHTHYKRYIQCIFIKRKSIKHVRELNIMNTIIHVNTVW